jgi:hypothetical protein
MAVCIELRTTCPKCGLPVPVNALVAEVPCPTCDHAVQLGGALWHEVISEAAGLATGDKNGGQTALEIGATLTKALASPACPACGEVLALGAEPPGDEPAWIACGCGSGVAVRPFPRALVASAEPFFTHLAGEEPALVAVAAPPRQGGSAEAVLFTCPGCGRAIAVDAASNRIVQCDGCRKSAYLPDDLWKWLHPVNVTERWYVWVDEERLQGYRMWRRTNARADVWLMLASLGGVVLLGGLMLFAVNEMEVPRETATVASAIGYVGLAVSAVVGAVIRRPVQGPTQRRLSAKLHAIVLLVATVLTASIVVAFGPPRTAAERERWRAAAIRCCETVHVPRDQCEQNVAGTKTVSEARGLYELYKHRAETRELRCEP